MLLTVDMLICRVCMLPAGGHTLNPTNAPQRHQNHSQFPQLPSAVAYLRYAGVNGQGRRISMRRLGCIPAAAVPHVHTCPVGWPPRLGHTGAMHAGSGLQGHSQASAPALAAL